jgi:hypothetical protein
MAEVGDNMSKDYKDKKKVEEDVDKKISATARADNNQPTKNKEQGDDDEEGSSMKATDDPILPDNGDDVQVEQVYSLKEYMIDFFGEKGRNELAKYILYKKLDEILTFKSDVPYVPSNIFPSKEQFHKEVKQKKEEASRKHKFYREVWNLAVDYTDDGDNVSPSFPPMFRQFRFDEDGKKQYLG